MGAYVLPIGARDKAAIVAASDRGSACQSAGDATSTGLGVVGRNEPVGAFGG